MFSKTQRMLLVIAIFVLMASTAYSATASKEQQRMINSLSAYQLYELYAEQALSLSEQVTNTQLPLNYRTRVKNCLIELEKSIFTEHEIRVIFIQPADMDYNYYQRKVDLMYVNLEQCF